MTGTREEAVTVEQLGNRRVDDGKQVDKSNSRIKQWAGKQVPG